MARSFIRQDTQVRPSDVYDDTFAMANAETSATNIEDDLNYVRSQLKVLNGQAHWYLPPLDGFGLTAIHNKTFALWVQKAQSITVGAGNNFALLAGVNKPSEVMAIAPTALGAIVSQLAGTVGANDLTVMANRENVVEIRDAATNLPIYTPETTSGVKR